MMGLSGWRGSVMRMPTPAEAITSSRTRRTSRTAFNDRRDGGLGEALLTDHLHPIQIARQFIHATPNLGGIALFRGLLERGADPSHGAQPITSTGRAQAAPQAPGRPKLAPRHCGRPER